MSGTACTQNLHGCDRFAVRTARARTLHGIGVVQRDVVIQREEQQGRSGPLLGGAVTNAVVACGTVLLCYVHRFTWPLGALNRRYGRE